MSISISIHPSLQHITDNKEIIIVEGSTVGECFRNLVTAFPELEEWLFENKDKLSKYIDVFVNEESAYPEELKKKVNDGDEIYILMQIAGG